MSKNPKSFYQETIEDIKNKINYKNYEAALEIIDKELSLPYVPLEFEQKLIKLATDIKTLQPTKNVLIEFNLNSFETALFKGETDKIAYYLSIINNYNPTLYLPLVQKYLKWSKLIPSIANTLLLILKANNIDLQIELYNNQKYKIVNLKKLKNPFENPHFNKIQKLLNKKLAKTPSALKMAHIILNTYTLGTFFDKINDEITLTSALITKAVDLALDNYYPNSHYEKLYGVTFKNRKSQVKIINKNIEISLKK